MTTPPTTVATGQGRGLPRLRGLPPGGRVSGYDALFRTRTIVEVEVLDARGGSFTSRTSDPPRSHLAIAWIVGLYKIEEDAREARKKHPEWDDTAWHAYRYDLRIKHSTPILETIRAWLDAERPKVLPKSPLGEAIAYALNHWAALIRPLEAGFLEIDNGASERSMKPIALGRKNWLFAGNDEGGKTAATLMSLCTTCKDLGIDPFAYLRDVLDR